MEEELELPADPLEGLTPEQAAVAARFADQLRIAFSVLELGRDDPGEEAFWSMLTRIDPAAAPEREPVFIPVFGRGRALLALPASEASEDAIAEICGFLTGPCSCQVKDSNPGVDILSPVHWDAALGDAGDPSTQLLPLVVPDPQVAAAPPPAPLIPPSAPPTTAAVIPAWAHTVLFVVAGLLLAAILGSILLLRPRRNPPGRRRWEQSD